jgi:hypothetical protein
VIERRGNQYEGYQEKAEKKKRGEEKELELCILHQSRCCQTTRNSASYLFYSNDPINLKMQRVGFQLQMKYNFCLSTKIQHKIAYEINEPYSILRILCALKCFVACAVWCCLCVGCLRVCVFACLRVCVFACSRVRVFACSRVCVFACLRVCVDVLDAYHNKNRAQYSYFLSIL